jgi:predicted ATP-grasp superfamily ATP-dependent carboligase
MLCCAVKRKLRMSPPNFGPSCLAVSQWNAELVDVTARLAAALRYTGHANFEFRYDSRDGTCRYIEMNPRIQANAEFDDACGVPTVWTTYQVCVGASAPAQSRPQRDGVVFLDLWPDLASRLAEGRPAAKALLPYLALLFRRRSGQYFAWDDPIPGWRRFCGFARHCRARLARTAPVRAASARLRASS